MSTALWYKGVLYADQRISGDTLVCQNGRTYPTDYRVGRKMFQVGKMVYAVTGTLDGWHYFQFRYHVPLFYRVLDRLTCWHTPPAWVIGWDGKNLEIWNYSERKYWFLKFSWWTHEKVTINDDTLLTMGSGGDYAREAIKLGLTPEEAICYAAERDPYTDCNINFTTFEVGNEQQPSKKANPIQVLVHFCKQYVLQWCSKPFLGCRKGEVL